MTYVRKSQDSFIKGILISSATHICLSEDGIFWNAELSLPRVWPVCLGWSLRQLSFSFIKTMSFGGWRASVCVCVCVFPSQAIWHTSLGILRWQAAVCWYNVNDQDIVAMVWGHRTETVLCLSPRKTPLCTCETQSKHIKWVWVWRGMGMNRPCQAWWPCLTSSAFSSSCVQGWHSPILNLWWNRKWTEFGVSRWEKSREGRQSRSPNLST